MEPLRSSSPVLHPLDKEPYKSKLQKFQHTLEKIRAMKPVNIYHVFWNVPEAEIESPENTTYYINYEDAKAAAYDENHSHVDKVTALQDNEGNTFLLSLSASMETCKVKVTHRKKEAPERTKLEKERLLKKRKRIDKKLEKLNLSFRLSE